MEEAGVVEVLTGVYTQVSDPDPSFLPTLSSYTLPFFLHFLPTLPSFLSSYPSFLPFFLPFLPSFLPSPPLHTNTSSYSTQYTYTTRPVYASHTHTSHTRMHLIHVCISCTYVLPMCTHSLREGVALPRSMWLRCVDRQLETGERDESSPSPLIHRCTVTLIHRCTVTLTLP